MDGEIKDKSKVQGRFFWKKRWYSFCSIHRDYRKDCHICNVGIWHNVWRTHISGLIYDIAPKFWVWWVNKK
jgi:hypothetical protein